MYLQRQLLMYGFKPGNANTHGLSVPGARMPTMQLQHIAFCHEDGCDGSVLRMDYL